MNEVLSITQIVCGGIVFLLVLWLLGIGVLALTHRLFEVYYKRGQQDQYQRDCDRIRTGAAWFSEDVPTMNMVRNLVEYGDIGNVRDQWRKDRGAIAVSASRLDAVRLTLCSVGLSRAHHDTPEKAAQAAVEMIAYFRREMADPPHDVQCAVLRKLGVEGHTEDEKPRMRLVPIEDIAR